MARRFMATIRIRGANPYILICASRAKAIKAGWREPLPVLVRVNGKPERPWRNNLMPVGDGSFYLYLHGSVREASNTTVGDRVEAEVIFDGTYKSGPQQAMPAWFKRELLNAPRAMKNWKALVPSRQKEVLRYFSRLKSPEGRARNLLRILPAHSGEPAWTMGRAWTDGS
jgi:hypothetical protein